VIVALAVIVTAVVVGVVSLFASPASASSLSHARNGVGVIQLTGGQRIGPHEQKLPGQPRERAPGYDRTVVGSGVAPEEAGSGTETFYRTMSKGNFEELQATGRVPATSETFISPSGEYASGYEGTTVRFSVRGGTTDALANVGVRDSSALTGAAYPDMPFVSSGWTSSSAFFKGEGGIINIGLGRGTALDIFNEGIVGWDVVP
jgi:hypothetical protein